MDYDPAVASDVLDFLFKPNFGLNLQMLKVEIGGDTDATEGAEPSHIHSKDDPGNYNRGYEWWLMKEAKQRNPDIKLYGLPWGWPGWLDPTATADKQAKNAFADPAVTANYTLQWLLGAKREHNLDIDYVGQWNERNAPSAYNDELRKVVAASGLKTTCLNRLPHYPGTTNTPDSKGCTQYQWNTTDGSRWVDEEGSWKDGRSARCLARCVNRNYVSGCHTSTFQWHLVSSFYDYLPWSRCGVAVANQPWSGAYEVTSPTWALAHTSQFAPIGWRYAQHGKGVSMLEKGGSIVTRVSPDAADFSIVIEKMSGGSTSACARGSNPSETSTAETITLQLEGSMAKAKTLQVWYSDLTDESYDGQGTNANANANASASAVVGAASDQWPAWKRLKGDRANPPPMAMAMAMATSSGSSHGFGVGDPNPADSQLFLKRAPLVVSAAGTVTLTVAPNEIYTLTTLNTGGKGTHASQKVGSAPFPLPWKQTFDDETLSAPPKIWYDQMGAWEVQKSTDTTKGGNVMRQVSPVWPECWGYSCTGPTTYFGPQGFNASTKISFSLNMEDHAKLTLTAGETLALSTNGSWSLGLHTGTGSGVAVGKWILVELELGKDYTSASVDGKLLTKTTKGASSGWNIKVALDRYVYASIDDFSIEAM
jgi:galactosylceramidase